MAPFNVSTSNGTASGLCTSPMCVHIASEILWNLAPNHTEIDPCTDFDKYTCDGWKLRHETPAGQATYGIFQEQLDSVQFGIKKIIEGPYPNGTDAGWISVNLTTAQVAADKVNFANLQGAYATCLNRTAREDEGLDSLTSFLETIIESFPVGPGLNQSTIATNMGRTIALMESYHIPTFQSMYLLQQETDPTRDIVHIIPPTFPELPTTTDNETITEYATLVTNLFAAAHPQNISEIQAGLLVIGIVDLVTKIGLALSDPLILANLLDTSKGIPTVTMDAVQSAAPILNYQAVIEELGPDGYKADLLGVPGLPFYANLSSILAQTSPEVIQGFFIWRAIAALSSYVVSDVADAYNRFIIEQRGQDPNSQQQQWQKCIDLLDNGVDWIPATDSQAIGPTGLNGILVRFFLDKHYSQKARDLVTEMLNTTHNEFIARIDTMDWISPATKKLAQDKARRTLRKVGIPTSPAVLDPERIGALYERANLTNSTSHFQNVLNMVHLAVAEHWSGLGQPVDKGGFILSTTSVNAYYYPWTNEITMLAGLQQFPIFDYDYPTYLSYGGMGSIVTHELIHGFDNRGRLYDATGNRTVWWDNTTITNFETRAQCFVEQFSNYTITAPNGTRLPVNGQFTLGENIADTGGVVGSFAAWKRWEKEHGGRPAKKLPGLEAWSNEQLFFIKWGQMWCDQTPPAVAVRLLTADNHSPAPVRIKGPLENSRAFKEAFKCPVKEPKCELW